MSGRVLGIWQTHCGNDRGSHNFSFFWVVCEMADSVEGGFGVGYRVGSSGSVSVLIVWSHLCFSCACLAVS